MELRPDRLVAPVAKIFNQAHRIGQAVVETVNTRIYIEKIIAEDRHRREQIDAQISNLPVPKDSESPKREVVDVRDIATVDLRETREETTTEAQHQS